MFVSMEPENLKNREMFYKKLDEFYRTKNCKKPWNEDQYKETILELQNAKTKVNKMKSQHQYHLLRTYDLLKVGEESHVIMKHEEGFEKVTFIVPYEKFYEKKSEFHTQTGHGGRDKIEHAIKKKVRHSSPIHPTFFAIVRYVQWEEDSP